MSRRRPERREVTCVAEFVGETGKAVVVDAAMVITLVSFVVLLRTFLQMTKVPFGYRWGNYDPIFPDRV